MVDEPIEESINNFVNDTVEPHNKNDFPVVCDNEPMDESISSDNVLPMKRRHCNDNIQIDSDIILIDDDGDADVNEPPAKRQRNDSNTVCLDVGINDYTQSFMDHNETEYVNESDNNKQVGGSIITNDCGMYSETQHSHVNDESAEPAAEQQCHDVTMKDCNQSFMEVEQSNHINDTTNNEQVERYFDAIDDHICEEPENNNQW